MSGYSKKDIADVRQYIQELNYGLIYLNEQNRLYFARYLHTLGQKFENVRMETNYVIELQARFSGDTLVQKKFDSFTIDELKRWINVFIVQLYNIAKQYPHYNSYNGFSKKAETTIYGNHRTFVQTETLFTRNDSRLTVKGLLDVLGHTVKCIEAIKPNSVTKEISEGLLVLKGIENIIKGRNGAKPNNEAMHYANDLLLKVANEEFSTEENRRANAQMSLLFDLAIDLFVRG